jgi:O-antigen/teichoic acid export membrane protein
VTTNPFLQALFVIGERLVLLVPQVATFVLISRYAGREMLGQYTLVLTWATLFQTSANFGITECLAREIGREPAQGSVYFTHGAILALGFALTAMAVMAPAVWCMGYDSEITVAILLAAGTLLPAGIVGACRGAVLANRRVELMMAVGLVETAILLPGNAYWIVTGAGLLPIVATIVLAKAAAGCVAFVLVQRRVTPIVWSLQPGIFRQLWKVTVPFGITAQLPALRFDILLLSRMATFAALGLYSAAAKVAELLLIFPLAFYLTMLPRVSGDLVEKPAPRTERLTAALAWYFAIVVPVGVGMFGLAPAIMGAIYGGAFVGAAPLLRIQLVSFLIVTVDVVLMMLCRATGFLRADLGLVVTTAVANLGLNLLLIPRFGATGAAVAAALSVLTGLVLRWRLVARAIVRLDWSRLIGAPLAVAVLVIAGGLSVTERIPWPLIAVGYVAGYGAIATIAFPFLRTAVRAALCRRKAVTG